MVEVDGDRAVATGYATIFLRIEGRRQVGRQSFGRWELARQEGQWRVTRRIARSVGRDDAGEVVKGGLYPTLDSGIPERERPEGGNPPPQWTW